MQNMFDEFNKAEKQKNLTRKMFGRTQRSCRITVSVPKTVLILEAVRQTLHITYVEK